MTSLGMDGGIFLHHPQLGHAHARALFSLFVLDFQPNSKLNFKNLKTDMGMPRTIKISILILKYVLQALGLMYMELISEALIFIKII
jgi:hypothetical protein